MKLSSDIPACDKDALDGKFGYHMPFIQHPNNAETESSGSEDVGE